MTTDPLTTYLQNMLAKPIGTLDKAREYELAELIAKGDQNALDELVMHNLRLVVFIVRKMTAWQYSNVPPEDILQYGNEGLILAAKKWTPINNAGFASYAGNYILRHVTRQLDNFARTIRLPVNIIEEIKKMNYLDRQMRQSLGREPTPKELAAEMQVSTRRISQLKGYVMREPVSLDAILNDMLDETHED
jgi:RNA polymerase primary sigma factor